MGKNLLTIFVTVLVMGTAAAFAPPSSSSRNTLTHRSVAAETTTSLNVFGKKPDEDLSFIESRDMTRQEMQELNEENERIMNAELVGMTAFSVVISIPLFYLVWVGLFSETAGVADF